MVHSLDFIEETLQYHDVSVRNADNFFLKKWPSDIAVLFAQTIFIREFKNNFDYL